MGRLVIFVSNIGLITVLFYSVVAGPTEVNGESSNTTCHGICIFLSFESTFSNDTSSVI